MVATVLCINAGSSTLKVAEYAVGRDREPSPRGAMQVPAGPEALAAALSSRRPPPVAVGHRVVHGGPVVAEHALVDTELLARLDAAVPFAPLHLPSELAAMREVAAQYPDVTQVACFDTVFHQSMPVGARRLPLPAWVDREGVRRYGFHGLSCEYVVDHVGAETLGRAVIAHLGSGASLTAVRDGRSVDTTMAFTPAAGVVMGTRTGDLDPGVLLYLARVHGLDASALDELVNREAGLLGLSGATADMADLLRRRSAEAGGAAALAVEVFCRSVRKAVGALATVLDGLDTLVFTAGIGEHAPPIRAQVCENLAHLGVEIDDARNDSNDAVISTERSGITVRVVATDENLMIARHAARLALARG